MITEEEVKGIDLSEDIFPLIDFLGHNNIRAFNFSKLNEELFELGCVSSKMGNKRPGKRPVYADLVEESGDCVFRLLVAAKTDGLDLDKLADDIAKRVLFKAMQCQKVIQEGKYDKTV